VKAAVGVDFGTLSGRAVVVRGGRVELDSAVHEYRHGVMHRRLAATGTPLPPDAPGPAEAQAMPNRRDPQRHRQVCVGLAASR
jgi:ribulose kinase